MKYLLAVSALLAAGAWLLRDRVARAAERAIWAYQTHAGV